MSFTKKAFLSYSHVDSEFHDEFLKHIALMKLKKEIEIWSDVKLTLGDEITPEIIRKLNEAHVVFFLLSPDFFNSGFIMNEEVGRALENEKSKKIISIVLRPCDWKITDLKKYLMAPKDGEPIATIEKDRDQIWLEVIEAIRASIITAEPDHIQDPNEKDLLLKEEFVQEIYKSEVNFYHKNKETITLEDIFVYPDVRKLKTESTENGLIKTIDSKEIKNELGLENKALIIGEEQTGKTTLAKMLFRQYLRDGFLPLLLNVTELSTVDIEKDLKKAINDQYKDLSFEDYLNSQKTRVVLIDDFNLVKLNKKFQKKYLEEIEKRIGLIIVFGDKILQFYEKEFLIFSNYQQFEILPFGYLKRNELIEKWNSIGEEETIEEDRLEALTDTAARSVNQIIRGNIVPPKPIYVFDLYPYFCTNHKWSPALAA